MTKEEFMTRMAKLRANYTTEANRLTKEYALSNNPYKIGDIIEDHMGMGRILEFRVIDRGSDSAMLYECENLTRKGEVNKRTPRRTIWQNNVIRKHDK